MRLLVALIPACMWAAPIITHYEASYEVPYAGIGPQFAAWSLSFDMVGEFPNDSSDPITGVSMTGSPWPDAVLAGINVSNAGESINDHMLRVWFDSETIGRFTYTSRGSGLFDHFGSYDIPGDVNGNSTDEKFYATLVISSIPEPGTWLVTASALASGLIHRRARRARRRSGLAGSV